MGTAFEIAVGGGYFAERENAIYDRFHASGFEQRPDMLFEIASDLGFVGDGSRAHRGSREGETVAHDLGEIDGGFGALLDGDLDETPAVCEALEIARGVGAANDVQDEMDTLTVGEGADFLDEILADVVDGSGCAKLAAGGALLLGAGGGVDRGAERAGELDGRGADAAGAPVNENALRRLKGSGLKDVGPDREEGLGDARGFFDGEPGGDREAVRSRREAVVGVASAGDQGAYAVASLPAGRGIRGHDDAGNFETEDRGCSGRRRIFALALKEVGAVDAGSLDADQDFTWAGHGSGSLCDAEDFRASGAWAIDEMHRFKLAGPGVER